MSQKTAGLPSVTTQNQPEEVMVKIGKTGVEEARRADPDGKVW